MRVTLAEWLADPAGVTRALFAPDGPVSAEFPNYAVNTVQVDYATNLARILVRGATPETAGLVTPTEADTGSGKTLAILVTSLLNAVLRDKRALVTSYTRELNRQMMGRDGRVAAAVVTRVAGRPAVIAVRRPRSAFASPTACRAAAQRIEREATGRSEADIDARESAAALRLLGEWADKAALRAVEAGAVGKRTYATRFDGLIETFREENPGLERAIDRVPFEHYTLSAFHPEAEQAPYVAYRDSSQGADLLVATHAILIIDQACHGSILDPQGRGWASIVCDEGNRLEDAGRTALGTKRSASTVKFDRAAVLEAIAPLDLPVARRQAIANHMLDHAELADAFLAALVADADKRAPAPERGYRVRGDEPWIETMAKVVESTEAVIGFLKGLPGDVALDLASTLQRRQADHSAFLECVDRGTKMASYRPGQDIPASHRSWAYPVVDLSPRRRDPSLATVPKRGARVVSRLWRGDEIKADAFVVTSATLASPALKGKNAFLPMLETIGLDAASNNVGQDLALSFKQRDFGRLVELWLADPGEALPSQAVDDEGEYRSPEWLSYVADGIAAAHADAWNPQRNRVFVLCTSFDEAAAVGGALAGLVPDEELRVRGPDDPLRHGLEWFLAQERAVYVTVGAWDGIDRIGLADHLVVPRLPFPAPGHDRRAGVFSWVDKDGEERVSNAIERMLMLLAQGLGRAFRQKSDAAKVWVLDPRIGLPLSLQMEHGPGHDRSRPYYLDAFPKRFQAAIDAAKVFKRTRPPAAGEARAKPSGRPRGGAGTKRKAA